MASPHYTVKERRVIAETTELRVVRMAFAADEAIPWHYHTTVSDTTFCLAGEIVVEFRNPTERVILRPGEHVEVAPGRPHKVGGTGDRVSLLVQGVGRYDFVPVE